jgi:steroid 5-alpha reductase family enzyme
MSSGGWLSSQLQTLPALMPVLLLISLAVSALGFIRVVYFVSIGYAFSIVAMAIVTALVMRGQMDVLSAVQILLLVGWGLRLGIYIARREARPSYRNQLEGNQAYDRRVSRLKRIPIWISVALLYVAMFSPAVFALSGPPRESSPVVLLRTLGVVVMVVGLAIEALADQQKSAAKQRDPKQFVASGLYGWVRCPNYLGEILVWTGSFLVGLPFLSSVLRVVIALVGLVCIVLIMMGSTKRLERTQGQRYGHLPEYQQYTRRVPVLIPWVPVYTLQGVKVYLE